MPKQCPLTSKFIFPLCGKFGKYHRYDPSNLPHKRKGTKVWSDNCFFVPALSYSGKIIIFFPGNGFKPILFPLLRRLVDIGYGIYFVSYSFHNANGPEPSLETFHTDCNLAVSRLKTLQINPGRQIVLSNSLGTYPATYYSLEHDKKKLPVGRFILDAAYDDMKEVVKDIVKRTFIHNVIPYRFKRFKPVDLASQFNYTEILQIIHLKDKLILPERQRSLNSAFEKSGSQVYTLGIEEGHNYLQMDILLHVMEATPVRLKAPFSYCYHYKEVSPLERE
jgi:hypothetical protein